VAAVLLLWSGTTPAQDEVPAAAEAEQGGEGMEILMRMANYLAQAPSFSVSVSSGYDAIQEDGQRIEFGERRKILLQRPDRLRVEVERSDGDRGLVLFDGRAITAFKIDENVYARVEKPGSVEGAVVYLVRDLQMKIPLALMFLTTLPGELENRVESVAYVEENTLFDVLTDHLAARTEEIDFQVWVAQGEQPLPRRVVITYRNASGQPQFRADFTDWNLAPEAGVAHFTFTPPAGAEQIPFLAPVRKGFPPAQEGGKP
jgi:hypothetical protein